MSNKLPGSAACPVAGCTTFPCEHVERVEYRSLPPSEPCLRCQRCAGCHAPDGDCPLPNSSCVTGRCPQRPGTSAARDDYRIALRPDHKGKLDDTVVKGVSMFRAEMMDTNAMFMCCYLEGTDERIAFWVRGKNLRYDVTEYPPSSDFAYEHGSIGHPSGSDVRPEATNG